jgi:hypothetical protein
MSKMLPAILSIDCGGGLKCDNVVVVPDGQLHGRDLFGADALTVSREIFGVLSTAKRDKTLRARFVKPCKLVVSDSDGTQVEHVVSKDTPCTFKLKFKRTGESGFFIKEVQVVNRETGVAEWREPIDGFKFIVKFKGLESSADDDATLDVTLEAVHSPETRERLVRIHRARRSAVRLAMSKEQVSARHLVKFNKGLIARHKAFVRAVRTIGYVPAEPFQMGKFVAKLNRVLTRRNKAKFGIAMRKCLRTVGKALREMPEIEGPSAAMTQLRRAAQPNMEMRVEVEEADNKPAPGEIYNGDEAENDDPDKPVAADLETRVNNSGAGAYLWNVIEKYSNPDIIDRKLQCGKTDAFNVQAYLQGRGAPKKEWKSKTKIDQTNSGILRSIDDIKRYKSCIRRWRQSLRTATHLTEKDRRKLRKEVKNASGFIREMDMYVRGKMKTTFAKKFVAKGTVCFVRDHRSPPEQGHMHSCFQASVVGYNGETRATIIEREEGIVKERMEFHLPDDRVHFNRDAAVEPVKQQSVRGARNSDPKKKKEGVSKSKKKRASKPKPTKVPEPSSTGRRRIDSDDEMPETVVRPRVRGRRIVDDDSDDEGSDHQEPAVDQNAEDEVEEPMVGDGDSVDEDVPEADGDEDADPDGDEDAEEDADPDGDEDAEEDADDENVDHIGSQSEGPQEEDGDTTDCD